jgi:DNA helicase II / ATP-dependent DNA helicase PcrA
MEQVHKVILELKGQLQGRSYHQCIVSDDLRPNDWRPEVVDLIKKLRYDGETFQDADSWHAQAKELLRPYLPQNGRSISQKLRRNDGIKDVLMAPTVGGPHAKTIHSVKGKEFSAVCVVTVPQTLKGILDYLETGEPSGSAEAARELYVAASRAQRLLVIATPKNQSKRLRHHLETAGAVVLVREI